MGSCPKKKKYIVTVEKLVGSGMRERVDALAHTGRGGPGARTRGAGRLSRGWRRKGGGMIFLWTRP